MKWDSSVDLWGFTFLFVIGLATWSAFQLGPEDAAADLRTKTWVDAFLFWSGNKGANQE